MYFESESVDPSQPNNYCTEVDAVWWLTAGWRLEPDEQLVDNITFQYIENGVAYDMASVDLYAETVTTYNNYFDREIYQSFTGTDSNGQSNLTLWFDRNYDVDHYGNVDDSVDGTDFRVVFYYGVLVQQYPANRVKRNAGAATDNTAATDETTTADEMAADTTTADAMAADTTAADTTANTDQPDTDGTNADDTTAADTTTDGTSAADTTADDTNVDGTTADGTTADGATADGMAAADASEATAGDLTLTESTGASSQAPADGSTADMTGADTVAAGAAATDADTSQPNVQPGDTTAMEADASAAPSDTSPPAEPAEQTTWTEASTTPYWGSRIDIRSVFTDLTIRQAVGKLYDGCLIQISSML